MVQVKSTYFPQPGRDNTEEVLQIALERARELGIGTILVASTRGDTGARSSELFQGFKVIVVTHSFGFREPNTIELTEENRAKIMEHGGIILTTQHAFGGVGRAVRRKFNTIELEEIVANVFRIFGQGMKVVCEIALMAADAGLVRTDEDVLVIAGTGRGADTAVVLQPATAQDFFDMKIREILCKPRFDRQPSSS